MLQTLTSASRASRWKMSLATVDLKETRLPFCCHCLHPPRGLMVDYRGYSAIGVARAPGTVKENMYSAGVLQLFTGDFQIVAILYHHVIVRPQATTILPTTVCYKMNNRHRSRGPGSARSSSPQIPKASAAHRDRAGFDKVPTVSRCMRLGPDQNWQRRLPIRCRCARRRLSTIRGRS